MSNGIHFQLKYWYTFQLKFTIDPKKVIALWVDDRILDTAELYEYENLEALRIVSQNRSINGSSSENWDTWNISNIDYAKFPHLRVLLLNNTQLRHIPTTIFQAYSLEELHLEGNKEITELPEEIGNLLNLKVLNIANCKLGKLPERLGLLPLEKLIVSGNQITCWPCSLKKLKNTLWLLALQNNTGPFFIVGAPPFFPHHCINSSLHSDDPDYVEHHWMEELSNLSYIDISGIKCDGNLPIDLKAFNKLEELHCNNIGLKTLPSYIKETRNCRIYLGNNPIIDLDINLNDPDIQVKKFHSSTTVRFISKNLKLELDESQYSLLASKDSVYSLQTISKQLLDTIKQKLQRITTLNKSLDSIKCLSAALNKQISSKEKEVGSLQTEKENLNSTILHVKRLFGYISSGFVILVLISILVILRNIIRIKWMTKYYLKTIEANRLLTEAIELKDIAMKEREIAILDLAESRRKAFVNDVVVSTLHTLKQMMCRIAGYIKLNNNELDRFGQAYQSSTPDNKTNEEFHNKLKNNNKKADENISLIYNWIRLIGPISKDQTEEKQQNIDLFDYLKKIRGINEIAFREQNILCEIHGDPIKYFVTTPGIFTQVITIILENVKEHAFIHNQQKNKKIDILIQKVENGTDITIRNNGRLIPDEIKDRIFCDCYSSNKIKEKNKALGLDDAKMIMEEIFGGSICFEQDPTNGVSFLLHFPKTTIDPLVNS